MNYIRSCNVDEISYLYLFNLIFLCEGVTILLLCYVMYNYIEFCRALVFYLLRLCHYP